MGQHKLVPVDLENLCLHYAASLDEWARRFESNVQEIEKMADPALVRTWRTYLNGPAASFRWGDLRLYQILFTNGLNNDLPPRGGAFLCSFDEPGFSKQVPSLSTRIRCVFLIQGRGSNIAGTPVRVRKMK